MSVISEKITDPKERRWALLHTAFALFFLLFYVYNPVNKYLWETVRYTYVLLAIPLAVGFYYYFRRMEGGTEQRLMICYTLWFYITRVLNGQLWLQNSLEFDMVCEMAVCSVILPVGGLLSGRGRKKLLDWACVGLVLFFLPLGLVGIYAYMTRSAIYNPITEASLAVAPLTKGSINLVDTNVNTYGFLYLILFLLMVYQFFTCEKKLWRVPAVLTAVVSYFIMVFSFSRNAMITFSVCVAMLLVLLARARFPGLKKRAQALMIAGIFVCTVPLGILSFRATAAVTSRIIYHSTVEAEYPPELLEPEESPQVGSITEDTYTDSRDLGNSMKTLSGRLPIFWHGILTMVEMPDRILRGALFEHVMDVHNKLSLRPHAHMHNYLLQTLGLTGVPGFLLVLAFTVLVVRRMIRIFFSEDPRAGMPLKLMTLPLTAYFLSGMLEVHMFGLTDQRAYLFFMLTGIFLAETFELYPPEERKYPVKKWIRRIRDHGKN